MAIAYATSLRNTRMDAINTAVNAGAGAGLGCPSTGAIGRVIIWY